MTPTQRESFKPGDRVSWNEAENQFTQNDRDVAAPSHGEFVDERGDFGSGVVVKVSTSAGDWYVRPMSILRPAPIEAVEMYGTQPSELPETLPAGVRTVGQGDGDPEEYDAHQFVRLEDFEHGQRYVCDEGAGCCWCPPSHIDWTTVPRPPSKPAPVAMVLGIDPAFPGSDQTVEVTYSGGVPIRHRIIKPAVPERPSDPYTEHRRRMHASYPQLQEHRGPELSNLEVRAAHVEYLTKQLDRPIRTGPLKNRDRYGQKLSLRGWETEE